MNFKEVLKYIKLVLIKTQNMINLQTLTLRELQQESSRAVVVLGGNNQTLSKFNKEANHDSQKWYLAVLNHYIDIYGDLPSKSGPGTKINIIL